MDFIAKIIELQSTGSSCSWSGNLLFLYSLKVSYHVHKCLPLATVIQIYCGSLWGPQFCYWKIWLYVHLLRNVNIHIFIERLQEHGSLWNLVWNSMDKEWAGNVAWLSLWLLAWRLGESYYKILFWILRGAWTWASRVCLYDIVRPAIWCVMSLQFCLTPVTVFSCLVLGSGFGCSDSKLIFPVSSGTGHDISSSVCSWK